MSSFKLWLEVKSSFGIIQQIKEKLEKDKYATIWLDGNGNVQIDYPEQGDLSRPKFRKIYRTKMSIQPEDKIVHFEIIGDKINAGHKKLLKFLMDSNIIDDTWKVQNGKSVSEYIGYDFTKFYDKDIPTKPSDVSNLDVLSPNIDNIVLYHGTSEYDWDKIQKKGVLYPLFIGSNQEYGSESRFKHEYNKDLLYLATNIQEAWNYAKARARNINKKINGKDWEYQYGNSPQNWSIRPVLLRVNVPDVSKLRSDDDVANDRMREIGRKLWDKKSPEEQKRIMKELSTKVGFSVNDPSSGQMLWRDTDQGFIEIIKKLKPNIYKTWLSSMLRKNQVAYKGFIPIKFIKEIPVFDKR